MHCEIGRTDVACHCVYLREGTNGTSINVTSAIDSEDMSDLLELGAGETED